MNICRNHDDVDHHRSVKILRKKAAYLPACCLLPTLLFSCGYLPLREAPPVDVDDELRAACPDYSDTDIEALIIRVQADYARGITKRKEILDLSEECDCPVDGDCAEDLPCVTCSIHVIEAVYEY